MEPDRFKANQSLFIIGMSSLVLSLGLISFSLYLMPALVFGLFYNIPDFIYHWRDYLETNYNYTASSASITIFFGFFLFGLLFALIAYLISNHIDKEILHDELVEPNQVVEKTVVRNRGESVSLFIKILMIAIGVLIVVGIFEWILYTPPPAT